MSTPSPTPAGSRALILTCASRLFASKGLHGVPMREIAIECGLTMPTIYHFFGCKESLYSACLTKALEDTVARLRATLENEAPRKRVDAFVAELCRLLLREPTCLSFACQLETISVPDLDSSPLSDLMTVLDDVVAESGFRRPSAGLTAGQLIVASAIGQAAVWRTLHRGASSIDAEVFEDFARQVREAALTSQPQDAGR